MVDIFNREINIGNLVSFNPPSYKGLKIGRVVGFTPQKVKVSFDRYDHHNLTIENIHNFSDDILHTTSIYPKDVTLYN